MRLTKLGFRFLIFCFVTVFLLTAGSSAFARDKSKSESALGFKIRDCQFRLFSEQGSFWLEFERTKEFPKVYFARINKSQSRIEIGLNCPVRIKDKLLRINHDNYKELAVKSDGLTFVISISVRDLSLTRPEIIDIDKKDEFIEVLIQAPLGAETNFIDEEVSKKDRKLDETAEEFFDGAGKVLLPKPGLIDRLSAEKLGRPIPGQKSSSSSDNNNSQSDFSEKKVPDVSKEDIQPKAGTEQGFEPIEDSKYRSKSEPSYQELDTDISNVYLFYLLLISCSAVLVLWYRAKSSAQNKAREQLFREDPKKTDISDSYALLGVRKSDSNETIKKRYKHLVKVFHADKLSAKDLPEEMVLLANERFQQIQDAYDKIRQARGF